MGRCCRGVLWGALTGCAAQGADDPPRATELCQDGEPARCGFGEGLDAVRNAVLVCDDGTWSEALSCGTGETCSDDEVRGAVACTDKFDQLIYGEQSGPCAVDGAQSCSFEREFVLLCEDGNWSIGTNCSTDVLLCTLLTGDDDPSCSSADGCLSCA